MVHAWGCHIVINRKNVTFVQLLLMDVNYAESKKQCRDKEQEGFL